MLFEILLDIFLIKPNCFAIIRKLSTLNAVFFEKSKVVELGFDFHFEVKFDYFFSSILNVGILFVFLLFFSFEKYLLLEIVEYLKLD